MLANCLRQHFFIVMALLLLLLLLLKWQRHGFGGNVWISRNYFSPAIIGFDVGLFFGFRQPVLVELVAWPDLICSSV